MPLAVGLPPVDMSSATQTPVAATRGESTRGLDVDSLQQKYAQKRAKRLHNDQSSQKAHNRPSNISEYLKDPYVEPGFSRDPIKAVYDITIIGAGYTGVQIAARLIKQDYTNISLIERGGDVGGTW